MGTCVGRSSRLLILFIGLVLVAAACGGGDGGSPGPEAETDTRRGGDLVIARVEDSQSMDKTSVFQNESIWILQQMFETLYTVSPDGKELMPWLATGHTVSEDKLTWTFTLREGVKFSNGEPMTSEDVKFSLDEATAATEGWGYINEAIAEVQAPDPQTVVIRTKYPWSPLLADLSLFANGIIPADYGGRSKEEFYQAPVGTGPFQWDHWTRGDELTLVRNPNYWQEGKPYLDSVTWKLVSDDNTRVLQLKGGQIDIAEFPPWSSVADLQATPGVEMRLFPSTRTDYMLLNEEHEPFQDVHVRRAISSALDREAMIETVLFGNGEVANSFLPPQLGYYDPETPGLQFDLEAAKQEMAQSAYPQGFEAELLVGAGDVDQTAIAQIVQGALQPLGIDVTLRRIDPAAVFSELQQFNYQMGFSYWTMDIADADQLVTFAVDGTSSARSWYTNYNNPEVTRMAEEARRTFDTDRRAELYSQIQAQVAQDAPMVFLYHIPFAYAHADTVNDFHVTPMGNYHLEDVWMSR